MWLLNPNEYIIPLLPSPGPQRVLEPALQDGVLPLYIRYSTVCDDDLDAPTWVPRLAVEAMRHLLDADPSAGGRVICTSDLQAALHAKG